MRPTGRSWSAPAGRRGSAYPLAVVLGVIALWLLAPAIASATPMHGAHPQVEGGTSMAPRAPVEIRVSPQLKEVLRQLLCQCGCNLDVYQCEQTMICEVSASMWDQAAVFVEDEGKPPEEALQAFAADYGEYVLAAPIKRGFNLVAWILPGAALASGAVILAIALRRWRPRTAEPLEVALPKIDPRYLDRLERELREGS